MFTLPWVAFFVVSGWWFWILFLLASGVVIRCLDDTASMMSESDDDFDGAAAGWAFFVIFLSCIIWSCFGDAITHFKWVFENPFQFFVYGVGGYIVAGIVWGIIWWTFIYVPNKLDVFEKILRKWAAKNGVELKGFEMPDAFKVKWWEFLLANYPQYIQQNEIWDDEAKAYKIVIVDHFNPLAWDNKARLTTKMAYWPWTMFWSLLSDALRALYNNIQWMLRGMLDAISRHIFRGVQSHKTTAEGNVADILAAKLTEKKRVEKAEKAARIEAEKARDQARNPARDFNR